MRFVNQSMGDGVSFYKSVWLTPEEKEKIDRNPGKSLWNIFGPHFEVEDIFISPRGNMSGPGNVSEKTRAPLSSVAWKFNYRGDRKWSKTTWTGVIMISSGLTTYWSPERDTHLLGWNLPQEFLRVIGEDLERQGFSVSKEVSDGGTYLRWPKTIILSLGEDYDKKEFKLADIILDKIPESP